MLSNQTVNFGENSTVNIGSHAQLYLLSSTIYGNLQFGTSTAYEYDGTYQAAIRTDGSSTSYIYGTVTLLKDDGVGAAISTRFKNEGNVEKGSKLVLYADVTGEGSLLKLEDSNDNAGVLSIGTIEKDGKTYGGTVDYAGPTNVRSGVLRILDGVTMYAQDDISLGDGTEMEGTFDLEKGAVLSIGAPDAKTGTELEFSGNGTVELGGTLEFDIFSESDFDKIILNADLLNLGELPESIDIKIAEGVEAGDEMIQLTQGFDAAFWEDVLVNLPSGWMYSISADGNLAVGGAAAVPEPGSMLLLLTGIGGLFMLRRKKSA